MKSNILLYYCPTSHPDVSYITYINIKIHVFLWQLLMFVLSTNIDIFWISNTHTSIIYHHSLYHIFCLSFMVHIGNCICKEEISSTILHKHFETFHCWGLYAICFSSPKFDDPAVMVNDWSVCIWYPKDINVGGQDKH